MGRLDVHPCVLRFRRDTRRLERRSGRERVRDGLHRGRDRRLPHGRGPRGTARSPADRGHLLRGRVPPHAGGLLWARGIPALLVFPALNGVFTMGQYSWMAIWLPELYPTSVRATGVALVFNASRFVACIGPLVAGSLIVALGGYGTTAVTFGCIYLVGLAVVWFCPETKGQPLQRG
ncbi:MAG: MFS transporter [Lapillicoccus sp.]